MVASCRKPNNVSKTRVGSKTGLDFVSTLTLPATFAELVLLTITRIIELSITIIISCAPFAVGFWRRIIQNSTFISSIRSPQHHRKSNHPRSPTPVTFPTIRTSQISSTRSDINLEALRPRCRESISREEDAGSIGPSEHTSTFTQGDFHDQLPYHAV